MENRRETDVELIQASLDGNTRAFEVLVRKYQSLVCAITFSGTGRIDTSEDLAQEALLLAWKNLHQLRELEHFPAWLGRIARNTVQAWRRKRQRDAVDRSHSREATEDSARATFEPAEVAMQKEQASVVQQALEQIPDKYREPLVLYYREHKSAREVGTFLNLSENATRQRITRARSMLKRQVAAMVETTLNRSRPDSAFTAAVMVSVGSVVINRSAEAAALGEAGIAGEGGVGLSAVFSGTATKLLATVTGALILAGGLLVVSRSGKEAPPLPEQVVPSVVVSDDSDSSRGTGPSSPLPVRSEVAIMEMEEPGSETVSTRTGDIQTPPSSRAASQMATADSLFRPRGVLSGVITDRNTGEPLTGVHIEISDGRRSKTQTDAQGFYSFPEIQRDGNFRIEVASKTHLGLGRWDELPVLALQQTEQAIRHFSLAPGCRVEVAVHDGQGQPIEGVQVGASWLGAERGRMDLGRDRSGPDGRVTIGAFEASAVRYRVIAQHDDYAPAYRDLFLTDPNVVSSLAFVLEPGIDVSGYAEYADGVPATGIRVGAKPDWWHSNYVVGLAAVEVEGHFTLRHVLPGRYSLSAHFYNPGGGGGYSFALSQAELPVPAGDLLTLRLPKESPQSQATISGRFIWKSKQRPFRVEVMAFNPAAGVFENSIVRGRLDTFEIGSLKPGTYTLSFEGDNLRTRVLTRVKAPSRDLQVVMEYEVKPRLQGAVVFTDDPIPVPRFQARMIRLRTLRGVPHTPQGNWNHFRDGRFDFEAPCPGIYQVQVMAEGYAPTLSRDINTDEGKEVIVSLVRGGEVRGTVTDAQGTPVTGAMIVPLSTARGMTGHSAEMYRFTTGAVESTQGEFVFEHLPSGRESFKVTHPDYAPQEIQGVHVTEGGSTRCGPVVLEPGASLEGIVFNAQAQPDGGVALIVQDHRRYTTGGDEAEATRLASVVTDANGVFRVNHLPPGRICYVMRKDALSMIGIAYRACVPIPDKVIRLDFGGPSTLSGVLHHEGVPLSNAKLRIARPGDSYSHRLGCTGQTDAFGRFAIRGLPAGEYGLFYEKPGQRNRWSQAAVFRCSGQDLDLGVVSRTERRMKVKLRYEQTEDRDLDYRVQLESGTAWWRRTLGETIPPQNPGDPFVVRDIRPGSHTLVASPADGNLPVIRKPLVVTAEDRDIKEAVVIPAATSTLSGSLSLDRNNRLFLWNEDETVVTHLSVQQGPRYLRVLPAGRYTLGSGFFKDVAPLHRLELRAGEHETLDIQAEDWVPEATVLSLQVVNGDSEFIDTADVLLTDSTGIEAGPVDFQEEFRFVTESGVYRLVVLEDGYERFEGSLTLPRTRFLGSGYRREYRTVILKRK